MDYFGELKNGLGGAVEVECQVFVFEAIRKDQAIVIELRDYGIGAPGGRFEVTAKSGGKETKSNPAESIKEACSILHWHGFD